MDEAGIRAVIHALRTKGLPSDDPSVGHRVQQLGVWFREALSHPRPAQSKLLSMAFGPEDNWAPTGRLGGQ